MARTIRSRRKTNRSYMLLAIIWAAVPAAAAAASLITGRAVFLAAAAPVLAVLLIPLRRLRRKRRIEDAGRRGEEITVRVLSSLPSSYTVFHGLTGRLREKTWEMDSVVLGPAGVYIIETKAHRGTFTASADDRMWHYEKRGKRVYEKDVYSPVMQVRTHVRMTGRFLGEEGLDVPVQGIVFFPNPGCVTRISGRTSVPLIHDGGELLQFIERGRGHLTAGEVDDLAAAFGKFLN